MRQYVAFKKQHPECVLFFRMGDFYEMFYEDALLCHKVLGITLTERTKGVPMAGVPYHSVEPYLRKMIEQGYRVAVADQVQDPREAKGVVDRAVTRVVTPGTLVDDTLLDDAQTNHIAAVLFTDVGDNSGGCLAVAELSTGTFELVDAPSLDALAGEAARFGIDELLYADTATGEAPDRVKALAEAASCTALTGRASWHFRHAESLEALTAHYGVKTLAGFGLDDQEEPAVGAAGALIRYLTETQSGHSSDSAQRLFHHIRPPHRRSTGEWMTLDATSLRSLEIERTFHSGTTAGSLLGVMQGCRTPMGKRLLRNWLCFPLRDLQQIRTRQRAVGAFVEDRDLADHFNSLAGSVQDVARIAGRLALGRAYPRDLVALGKSTSLINDLVTLLESRPAFDTSWAALNEVQMTLSALAEQITTMCVERPPAHMREGGLIRDGVDAKLDEARTLQTDAGTWLATYQQTLVKETGIPSLKVGYNKVFGYYIEVTHAHTDRVPDGFSRKQTLKNAERYITPPLKEFESKILNAEQRAIEREQELFAQLCRAAAEHIESLNTFAATVAELDVLSCFAEHAVRRKYVCPEIVAEPVIHIVGGRHPVLDIVLSDPFVPNDSALAGSGNGTDDTPASLALITGPNMAGKSTYIRQVALLTLLAHTGSYIPADSATIGLTDRIFTRIGASDELHAGRSTFMVEMTETANILHHATAHSLVILDEIGRGTSTLDGLSLAWAIAEQLAEIGCRSLFATHYHELTAIADRLPHVCNLHVTVREWDDQIIFVYRILPGRTDKSYGIHVAKIAGLPTAAIRRANELLESLEVQSAAGADVDASAIPESATGSQPPISASGQLSLFTEYVRHPVLDDLESAPLDDLTPVQAFDLLRKLKRRLDSDEPRP